MPLSQEALDTLDQMDRVANLVKDEFVAKDELVELLAVCAIAQEHLLIVGPPGTAKSELIKRFALRCGGTTQDDDGERIPYFEYLLTRFTEPNEIFGVINLASFQQGEGSWRETKGMLPRAEIVFLDEVFKANSAILNALLTILNERVFYNGSRREAVPLISAVGATNMVPDDEELAPLYDRFLIRVWTDNVEESLFPELFQRGWELENDRIAQGYNRQVVPETTTDRLRRLHQALGGVNLDAIAGPYREVVRRIRSEGIPLSDRRVIKLIKLVAASALRHRRDAADPGDFWVLRHVWGNKDQIPHLQAIVDPYIQAFQGDTWSPERPLVAIEVDLNALDARRADLRTGSQLTDFLRQVEDRRRELIRHSSSTPNARPDDQRKRTSLLDRVTLLIDQLMQALENAL